MSRERDFQRRRERDSRRSRDRGGRDRERERERSRSRSRSPGRYRERERDRDDRSHRDRRPSPPSRREERRSRSPRRREEEGAHVVPPVNEEVGKREKAQLPKPSLQTQSNKINERMAILKKLTHDDGSSEDEDGVIRKGANGITTETFHFQNNGEEGADEKEIMRIMGFTGFDSTKEKQVGDNVAGAAVGAVSKNKRRVYRQYMNRRGGFNRPLQQLA